MTNEILSLGDLSAISVGSPDAEYAVVLLHGFQMTPADLAPFAHSLNLPAWFVFPEGPLVAPPGRSWWTIDTEARAKAMAVGPRDFFDVRPVELAASRASLSGLLEDVKRRCGNRPIVLGGFSQGGMVSADTVLRAGVDVAGLALLSSSRVDFGEWGAHLSPSRFSGFPVFVSHGEEDDDLSFAAGAALRDAWQGAGADVRWVAFPQGHLIPLVVWRHLRKFIQASVARVRT